MLWYFTGEQFYDELTLDQRNYNDGKCREVFTDGPVVLSSFSDGKLIDHIDFLD